MKSVKIMQASKKHCRILSLPVFVRSIVFFCFVCRVMFMK